MKKLLLIGVAGTALLACAVVASPRGSSATLGVAMDRQAAALDLIDAMGGHQSVMHQIDIVVPQQMEELRARFPSMSGKQLRVIELLLREEMKSGADQLFTQIAGTWAKRFSVDELLEIAKFHRSTTGMKMRFHQEGLHRDVAEIARNWGRDVGDKVQSSLHASYD